MLVKSTKLIPSIATGISIQGKKEDCFIRAMVNAFGYDYDTLEQLCWKHGRKYNVGIDTQDLISVASELNLEGLIVGKNRTAIAFNASNVFAHDRVEKTLGKVVKELDFGRYVVIIEGHAVALVNGDLIDIGPNKSKAKVAMILWEKQQFPEFSTKKSDTIH